MDAGNTNVGVLCADGAKPKERFYVDLIPGRTNIVSLKKLRRQAGEAVSDDSSDENQKEAEKYIFLKLPTKKSSGAHPIQDKVQHKVEHFKSSKPQTKRRRKELPDHVGEEEDVEVGAKPSKRGKQHLDTATKSAVKGDFKIRLKTAGGVLILKKHCHSSSKLNLGKIGRKELPCQILPFTGSAVGTASVNIGTPKLGNEMLHLSILQLKMLVEHSKTPLIDVQGADVSFPDTEIQLSPQLKEKLGKVARWTELNEGRISEELIDCLMVILGKYLKRKTLKKMLREMKLEDLYASKAENKNYKQIKHQLVQMIRPQTRSLHIKVYSAPKLTKGIYSMGDHLEDKLCDVYDTFIQGLDEDMGASVVRRLFAKLADLWPEGTMNQHEIREAICRAKERRVVPSRK